jgi:multisubunit Na+/H+ antiporter MnhB subunit
MNIAFWLLVIIGLGLLWLLCSFLYRPIGKVFCKLWNDAKKAMFGTKEKE